MKTANISRRIIVASVLALLVETVLPVFLTSQVALAAPQFTQLFVRVDRHTELIATGGTVCATPTAASTSATEATITVTFPTRTGGTDFVVNSTAANWVVDSNNLPAGSTFWPGMTSGSTAASSVTGKNVTWPSGDLAAGTMYCFHFTGTNTLTNGQAGNSSTIEDAKVITRTSAPADINETNWSTALITSDQILVTAVVPPNFSLTLSTNADPFLGNLDPGAIVSTTGVLVSISTNAVGGWIAWVKDSAGVTGNGLTSVTANYTIESGLKDLSGAHTQNVGDPAFDLIVGREGYVMDVDLTTEATGGCATAVDAAFNSASGNGGGRMSNNFVPIAACTRPGAPAGTSDGDQLTLIERATIRGGTPAGSDYTDLITVVGAGNF